MVKTHIRKLVVEWNICRLVRIAGGVPIVFMGIREQHWPSILFGAVFVALGLFTTQCCSVNGCSAPFINPGKQLTKENVEFEEIK